MGKTNFDVVQANAFIGSQFMTQGNVWFVRPATGSDNYDGKSPKRAFATLAEALEQCVSGQNDVVYLMGEGNASALCTDYQSVLLDWNKDLVHLIGVNSGTRESPRSRIAAATTFATATPLFRVSGNGCLIQGIQVWGGVDGHNQITGAVEVTGRLNHFVRCHFAGLNGAAGENDIANAFSLKLTGAIENVFEDCVIGNATSPIGAGATTSQILFSTLAQENLFRRCSIIMEASSSTNHVFLRAPAGSGVIWNVFEDCDFVNTGTNLTYASVVASNCGGLVRLRGATTLYGATDWNSTDSGTVIAEGIGIAANTFGFAAAVTIT